MSNLQHARFGGSSANRVKSDWTLSQRLASKIYKVRGSDCLLIKANKHHRYANISWHGADLAAHRAMWTVMRGAIPESMCVCHKCDVPTCVNVDHLFLGTHLENMRDRDKKGRRIAPVGLKHHAHKLTPAKVRAIRKSKASHRTLAKRFGVNDGTISNVKNYVTWIHIS